MQVYLRGQPIQDVDNIEDGEIFIENYQKKVYDENKFFIDKSEELIKKVLSIREKNFGESSEEYKEYIAKNYENLYEEIENLGKKFFKEDYVETIFHNSKDCLIGYKIKKETRIASVTLENISLRACTRFVYRKDFEIKQ